MSINRILITGGFGCIGSQTAKWLLRHTDAAVIVCSRSVSESRTNRVFSDADRSRLKPLAVDVQNQRQLEDVLNDRRDKIDPHLERILDEQIEEEENRQRIRELATEMVESGVPLLQELGEKLKEEGAEIKVCRERFSVLLPPGKPPESARKLAKQFYRLRGIVHPILGRELVKRVENTTRYNPENGSLLTEPRPFNLMFKTYVGPTATEEDVAYLRPETAQAIFAQFKNVHETSRQKVPFGIAQTGKAFRNEVTPRTSSAFFTISGLFLSRGITPTFTGATRG